MVTDVLQRLLLKARGLSTPEHLLDPSWAWRRAGGCVYVESMPKVGKTGYSTVRIHTESSPPAIQPGCCLAWIMPCRANPAHCLTAFGNVSDPGVSDTEWLLGVIVSVYCPVKTHGAHLV